MNDKKYYIELTHYKIINPNNLKRREIYDENSWIISYNKDEKYFICEKRSDSKITKMKNVENFIRIWNYDISKMKYDYFYLAHEGNINIYIENNSFSDYTTNHTSPISVDVIQKYIYLLKDIIEDEIVADESTD